MVFEPATRPDPGPTLHPLHHLVKVVAEATTLDDICEAALDCLERSLGVQHSSILTFDADGVMRFRAWRALSEPCRRAVDGHSPWYQDAITPQPVLVPDVLDDPALRDIEDVIAAEGFRALAFIPLTIRGKLLGKFMLYYPEVHNFTPEEIALGETIAAHVSLAIDQRQARERITLYENIFRSSLEGIAVISRNGRYVEQNPAHEALLGFADSELVGQTPAIHLGDDGFQRILDVLTSTGAFRGEIDSTARDGRQLTLDLSAFAVTDEEGALNCYVGIKRDVTERIQHEAELREPLSAKDAFLGMVSHELRTPLTIIAGNAGLLARRGGRTDGETLSAMVHEISANATRLSRIIDNMLALARIDQGVVPEVEPTLLGRLVQQVVAQNEKLFPGRVITITDEAGSEPVHCVPQYVSQVVENLLSNALKYTNGPVEVTVTTGDDGAEVHVLDRGDGVSDELRDRIFEPFARGHSREDYPGLGIGLSVCTSLIEAHNGELWVAPRPGGGSDFAFRLPGSQSLAL